MSSQNSNGSYRSWFVLFAPQYFFYFVYTFNINIYGYPYGYHGRFLSHNARTLHECY